MGSSFFSFNHSLAAAAAPAGASGFAVADGSSRLLFGVFLLLLLLLMLVLCEGPCQLPLEVMTNVQKELIDFHGWGLSVMEMVDSFSPCCCCCCCCCPCCCCCSPCCCCCCCCPFPFVFVCMCGCVSAALAAASAAAAAAATWSIYYICACVCVGLSLLNVSVGVCLFVAAVVVYRATVVFISRRFSLTQRRLRRSSWSFLLLILFFSCLEEPLPSSPLPP